MVYEWKSNSRIKAKPEKAAAVFEELERKGELTPAMVVEVSRPKNAPLHGEFQWVDKIAAEEYRKIQAQHLIMCLVVRDETDEVESRPVRAFFPVEEGGGYTHITRIISDEDMHQVLLDKAAKELEAVQRKYQDLVECRPVVEAIQTFVREVRNRNAETPEVAAP